MYILLLHLEELDAARVNPFSRNVRHASQPRPAAALEAIQAPNHLLIFCCFIHRFIFKNSRLKVST